MFRIDATDAVSVMPTPYTPGTPGYFQHGNPTTGASYTTVTSDWCNTIQEELMNVVLAAGLTPSKTQQNQLLTAIQGLTRVKKTNLSLYVNNATGSDASASAGYSPSTPFKTIQQAVNVISYLYDLMGSTATISVADGTMTQAASISGVNFSGGRLAIVGNTTSPQNCKIALPAAGSCFAVGEGAVVTISGFALEATTGGSGLWVAPGNAILSANNAVVYFDHIAFGACNNGHLVAQAGGQINITGQNMPYSIYGNAPVHMSANVGSSIIATPSAIVTLTGTRAFSSTFAFAEGGSFIYAPAVTYTGTATGQRYNASAGGYINTAAGGATYFPGSSAGVSTTGYYA